jgi:hypothetical protein
MPENPYRRRKVGGSMWRNSVEHCLRLAIDQLASIQSLKSMTNNPDTLREYVDQASRAAEMIAYLSELLRYSDKEK